MQDESLWVTSGVNSDDVSTGSVVGQWKGLFMAFDNSNSCIRSVDGEIRYWSKGNERLYGWLKNEAIGVSIHALLQTRFPAPLEEINSKLLEQGEWYGELVQTTKAFAQVRVASHWSIFRSKDDSVPEIVEVNNVVSVSESIEKAKYLAAIVASSDDGIMSKDLNGILTSWNAAAERIFGYTANEIIGKSVLMLFPPELVEEEAKFISRLQRGETISHYETVRLTKTGRRIAVSLSISPILNEDGEVIGAAKICRDISERKFLEHALLESEERQRLALEAGELGLWSVNVQADTVYWNERCKSIFGLPEDAPTPSYEETLWFLHSDDRDQVDKMFRCCIEHAEPFSLEFRIVQPSGATRWVESKSRPLLDNEGRVTAVYGIIADLTKRKKMEQALRQTNSELEQFAYAAAHDLQEPLRNISLAIELAKMKMPQKLDPEPEELFNTAVQNARQMEEMLRNLLAYSTVLQDADREWPLTDGEEMLRLALRNLDTLIRETGARITHDPMPLIRMEKMHLLQLFQNLVGNSLKYRSEHPPEVHLGVLLQGNYCRVTVRDNGIGISPAYRERVFGLFKRLKENNAQGTGIGLALCKRIVKHYGGDIWVESGGGMGTTICFAAPACEREVNVYTAFPN